MAPAQMSIDQDQETKPEIAVKASEANGDKSLKCFSNCEDTTFDMETLSDQKPTGLGDVENTDVDIIGGTDTSDVRLGKADETDAEYSSSFGDTFSGNEDGSRLSDSEVDSLYGDNGMDSNLFDGFDSMFRMGKKKLTTNWRRYIGSLTWRCKWMELRIKEMRSQELKYGRELAAYDQREQLYLGECTSEDCSVRSLPFSGQSHRNEVMKRRKRKRIEDMVDMPSYMSHHNLFSYYENKKFDADGAPVDDDGGIQVIPADANDDAFDNNFSGPSLEYREDENSLEHVLWKIEVVQSRVQKLKTQIDKLLTENAGKFSSMENLSLLVQSDQPTSSARSPTSSPRNGDNMPSGALYTPPGHISDYDIGDLVMPESAVSSYGEVTPLPDIIESSKGLLPAELPLDQSHIGDSCENIVNEVLIHNQEDQKKSHDLEKVSGLPIEKLQVKVKEEENVIDIPPTVPAPKPESIQEANTNQEQSVLKSCLASEFHVPKNKRKRGERKAGSGTWNADKICTQILS